MRASAVRAFVPHRAVHRPVCMNERTGDQPNGEENAAAERMRAERGFWGTVGRDARKAGLRAGAAGILAAALVAAGCAAKKPAKPETPVEQGKRVFSELGCNACHSVDGTAGVGPTLKGLYGSEVKLVGGGRATADDAYLRESILDPDAKTVEGFSKGVMASAVSKQQVEKDNNLNALIAYIKSLKGEHPGH